MALCPKCKTESADRSHRRSLFDRLAHAAGFSPYRCKECNLRFLRFRFSPPPEIPAAERGTVREIRSTRRQLQFARIKQQIYLYTLAGLIFLTFLYFIARERG
jgi:hypothetical protein